MSRKKDEDDENQENLMILRLPDKYAQTVRQAVSKGNLRERLQVDIKDDCRNALLKIENDILSARIVDLPCIVECQKTVDNKTFYKSGDICQMLLVAETPLEAEDANRSQLIRKEKNDHKKYVHSHGITPPFKNVRKKRFRKTAPKKIIDDPEVEKEVRRLLRADISAISVQTRIVYDKPHLAPSSIPESSKTVLELPGLSQEIIEIPQTATCDLSKMLDETLTADISATKHSAQEGEEEKSFDKELMEMFQDLSSDDGDSSPDEDGTTTKAIRKGAVRVAMDTSNSTSQDAIFELETLDRKIRGLEVEVARTTNSFLQQRLQDDLENLKKLRSKKSTDMD